jgi:hypothetical protein
MAFSSFSGPLRSGTVRQGSATNMGLVELVQTATVPFSAMTTSPTAQTLFTLPAGSRIMGFQVEVVTAISGGSVSNVGMVIGKAGSANAYLTTINTGLTSTFLTQATVDAATVVAQTNNIGTADVPVTGTFTAATGNPTAGSTVVSVYYLQRSDDGSSAPTA